MDRELSKNVDDDCIKNILGIINQGISVEAYKKGELEYSIQELEKQLYSFRYKTEAIKDIEREARVLIEVELEEVLRVRLSRFHRFWEEESNEIKLKLKKIVGENKGEELNRLTELLNDRIKKEFYIVWEKWTAIDEEIVRENYYYTFNNFIEKLNPGINLINVTFNSTLNIEGIRLLENIEFKEGDKFCHKLKTYNHLSSSYINKDYPWLMPKYFRNKKVLANIFNIIDEELLRAQEYLEKQYLEKIKEMKTFLNELAYQRIHLEKERIEEIILKVIKKNLISMDKRL